MSKQQTFRVTGHLEEVANILREKFSLADNGVLHRASLRFIGHNPDCIQSEIMLSKESPEVQAIVDEMILENLRAGVTVDELAKPAWMNAAIVEARARSAKQSDRYFIVIGDRRLGPHRLDLIRQWVAQDVLDEGLLVQPEKGTRLSTLGFMPEFWDFSPEIHERVDEVRRKVREAPMEPPTKKQLLKLEFFELPYPKEGLHRARASEILDVFMVLDRPTENRWRAQ